MPKKILFIFAGTGINAQMIRDFTEETDTGETFNDNVIRIYFNGCQDKNIGGHSTIKGFLDPDLDIVANKILGAFAQDVVVTLDLTYLKKEFGNSIIIEPKEGLADTEEIDDIILNGFSRGAIAAFATARALDVLNIPLSLLAEEPVPGNARNATYYPQSLYAKNFDLSACKNIVRAEILLGTYSNHNTGWENKWFRQMAPRFNLATHCYNFIVPKKMHNEFNQRTTTYFSHFLHQQGLTAQNLTYEPNEDRTYVIPKVEQQKFHFGVVGRTQYLPSYKMSVLEELRNKYFYENLCPINEDSNFKAGQALLALHNAKMDKLVFKMLAKAVLNNTDKSKGLREFIVEMDSIVQYSKEQAHLKSEHLRQMAALEENIYQTIADFYNLEEPSLKQRETFSQAIQASITHSKRHLPNKVCQSLKELTSRLLSENTLVHAHLVTFIDEQETFSASLRVANKPALDGAVTNAGELAYKLFHSSLRQRTVIFEQEKKHFKNLLLNASDVALVASFLTPHQLKEILESNNNITTMAEVLSLQKTLPTYEHRKIIYHAIKKGLIDMEPSIEEIVEFMEYLSDKKCVALCEILSLKKYNPTDLMIFTELMIQRLSENKIELLKNVLDIIPDECTFSISNM